jgi:single-strand DNA-binding protein
MNKVILIGRLTRDPEVRVLPSGLQVTRFSVAVSRKFKDKNGQWREETSFFDIECYGRLAERTGSQLSKGYQVSIEGELRQDKWQLPSGKKRSKIKIVASKVNLLGKPKSDIATKDTENAKSNASVEEEIAF